MHLHEPIVPGPTVSALIGFNGPMVGTFHASGEVPYQWLRPALRSLMMRLTFRVAVSESARETATRNWTAPSTPCLWNGIEIERIASAASRRPRRARPCCSSAGTNRARASRCCSTRGRAIDRDAGLRVSASDRRPTSCSAAPVARRRVVRHGHRRASATRRLRGATVFCAPSLRGESFGVVLLEAMAAGTPIVASAIEGYRNVARAGRDALLVPPGDVGALRDALRRLLDDAGAAGPGSSTAGTSGPSSSRCARLAERYLELYARALVPVADRPHGPARL